MFLTFTFIPTYFKKEHNNYNNNISRPQYIYMPFHLLLRRNIILKYYLKILSFLILLLSTSDVCSGSLLKSCVRGKRKEHPSEQMAATIHRNCNSRLDLQQPFFPSHKLYCYEICVAKQNYCLKWQATEAKTQWNSNVVIRDPTIFSTVVLGILKFSFKLLN